MKYLLILLFVLSTFLSCSTDKKSNYGHESVNIDFSPEKKDKIENTINVGVSQQTENAEATKTTIDKKNVSLMIGPGLYNSLSAIGFLSSLEKNKIKIQNLSGIEMGAIIAALYAKYGKSSRLEWEFYKNYNDYKTKIPMSENWYSFMDQFIDKHFKGLFFENLKTNLSVLVFDSNTGRNKWVSQGELSQVLKSVFLQSNSDVKTVTYDDPSTLFLKFVDDDFIERSLDSMTKDILHSAYKRLNHISGLQIIKFNLKEFDLDDFEKWQKVMAQGRRVGENYSRKVKSNL